jgi:phosphotransferase system HPr (HPr) family protein
VEKDIQVKLIRGLHARPSMAMSGKLSGLDLESVTISTDQITVNARSIMELLASCIICDTVIHATAIGKDAEIAIKAIEDVLTLDVNL